MASNVVKTLTEDFLHCSICINRFKDPKVLPCIHSFCLDCLEKYVQRLKSNKLPCPTCRKVCDLTETGVKGLQTNFHLVNLGERMDLLERLDSSKSNTYTCDSCEATDVVVYCLECDFKLCPTCQSQHKKFPTLRSHTLVPIKEIKKPKYQQALQNAKAPHCDLHPTESLRFYCKKCSKLICRDCTIVQHPKPDHECVEASCQLQDVKQGLSTLLNESELHLKQNEMFVKTGQAGLEDVARQSATVRQEIKKAFDEMRAAIEKQLKLQMENMCIQITEAEAQQRSMISEKVKRASTWVTGLKNIQEVTQKLIDENNMWEILGMSSNIMSAFHVLKCDSHEFSWHQSEVNQRLCFCPQTVPSVDLGRCMSEYDVVLSDSRGNFIICFYHRRASTVSLFKLRKDNDYNWDKADRIAPHKWGIEGLSNASLTAAIAENNQLVFVGLGSSVGVFNLSTKSFASVMISKGVKTFTHISWLGVVSHHNNYIYIKQSHESRVKKFYYEMPYEQYFGTKVQAYEVDGMSRSVEQNQRVSLSNAEETGWTIPDDHSIVNSIFVCNNSLLYTLDRKAGHSEGTSVLLLMENECYLIQPPPPMSLVSARNLSILNAPLEHMASSRRKINTLRKGYGIQQKSQNNAVFCCYFLWCGNKTLSRNSLMWSNKLTFVITQYDSRQQSNIRTWEVSEESGLPVACYQDARTGELKVCDKYGTVTTCFMHDTETPE
ncbi:E3 ubiquitin-protein ligase TRIM56 [Holothuria leucospilota]|uniref:E3 ubiquitin-protein ligase TRIM56 n=1 Tax=Holothuria leucospilota TaxID=206669 RepID=A0A9Q1BUT3_HOLLE|nr:E3 ubiquitin-protein ligase TRIM56 [Holothuria leucospilota]